MPDQQYDNEYVRRYKETDDDVEKFLGRIEAKYDRKEKDVPVDSGHDEAIANRQNAIRRDNGWTKPERKQGFQNPPPAGK